MLRILSRVLVLVTTVTLVLVPTVMRARQHVELREGTRLSIKLNWQGEAPNRDLLTPNPHDAMYVVVPLALTPPRDVPQPARRMPARAVALPRPPLDNAPDLFRGPPSLSV